MKNVVLIFPDGSKLCPRGENHYRKGEMVSLVDKSYRIVEIKHQLNRLKNELFDYNANHVGTQVILQEVMADEDRKGR